MIEKINAVIVTKKFNYSLLIIFNGYVGNISGIVDNITLGISNYLMYDLL